MMKEPLLLLHGALGADVLMRPLVDLLKADFEVYTFNFSGHGGKAIAEDFGIEQFTKDLHDFLFVNKLDNVNIFGYSMGGYVALNLARLYPDKVKKVFTLGTKFAWSPESAKHEVKFLDADKIEQKVPQFAQVLKERHAPVDWKLVLKGTADMMRRLGEQPVLTEKELTHIAQPVCIGLGGEDNMVTKEESRQVVNCLPNGEFKLFENMPHPIDKVNVTELAASLKLYFLH